MLALIAAACTPLGLRTEQQTIAAACVTASASIKVLTAANEAGKLTPQAQSGVVSAIAVVAPICAAEVAPTLDDVKRQAFVAAISALQLAAAQAQPGLAQ